MTVPLFVLALQPGGSMTVKRAREYLRSCRSHGRLYRVECCEVNPPPEQDTLDMSKRAYSRALFALELPEYRAAVAAIGLHSHMVTLAPSVQVRKASLALVQRGRPEKPFLFDQSGGLPDTQARLVAEALREWHQYAGRGTSGRSVAATLAATSNTQDLLKRLAS